MLPSQPVLLGDGDPDLLTRKSSSMGKACLGWVHVAQSLAEDARHLSNQVHLFQKRQGNDIFFSSEKVGPEIS